MQQVDFACIGTNDLTQYLFALSRNDEIESYDHDPGHVLLWDICKSLADTAKTG
jgi:phosphoenolpyruvate-protein kinase (PTS system EI component)